MESDSVAIFLRQVVADCSPIDGTEAIHLEKPGRLKIELCIPRSEGSGRGERRQSSKKDRSRREMHDCWNVLVVFNRVLLTCYNIDTLSNFGSCR